MIRYIAVFLLWLISAAAARTLTLEAALELADKQNKEIRLAEQELLTARANIKEAWSAALPTLDASFGYNRNFRQTFFYVNGADLEPFSFTFKNEYQFNAILRQTIYSFGKVGTALKIAYDYRSFVQNQYDDRKFRVIAEVKKAFYNVLLLKNILQVSKDSEESARSNYENTKARYESGTVSEFELLQAEVRWQNAIPDTMEAAKNYSLARNNLKSLLNLPIEERLNLEGTLEQALPFPETASFEQVLERRPDYTALQDELKMRTNNVRLEFAGHLPSLEGQLLYNYSAISDIFTLDNENKNLVLGISLNIPIFSGGLTSARVQKARVEVNKLKTVISQQEDRIRIELDNVNLRLEEARRRIAAAKTNVNSAQRAYEIAETRLQNGLATQLELKDSRVFLDQAQLNYYRAMYDYLSAYFDWEITAGLAAER